VGAVTVINPERLEPDPVPIANNSRPGIKADRRQALRVFDGDMQVCHPECLQERNRPIGTALQTVMECRLA
jgi:hypothetical protein